MPRPRKTELVSASSPATKAKKAKKPVKKIVPAKKAKPVIVDVIEDDDIIDSNNFFSDDLLSKSNFSAAFNSESKANEEKGIDRNDTDIQKRFFSDLVSEIKNKKEKINDEQDEGETNSAKNEKSRVSSRKSISLYRRLVWKFLIMVGLLAGLVFYFSFSKLTILITPQVEAMSDTLFLSVGDNKSTTTDEIGPREKVSGSVNEFDVVVEKEYEATGEEIQGEKLSGKVTIVNNSVKAQPLIATTRLLSNDNKLFRIKDAVNIPAGGKVEVEIYADKISADMAIAPSHFTIPGLWAGLQDKIYAESEEAFVYGEKVQKYIKSSDIQLGTRDINDVILEKAKESKQLRTQDEVFYQVLDSSEIEISAKTGDRVEKFTVKARAKVVAITFSKDEAAKLAAAKLNILVPDDKELAEFKPESLSYTLESYDDKNKVATVKASFSGLMILKSNANIIKRESLVNLSAQQIAVYLSDYPEIGNYELKFYPSFVKKAPNLVDRIEVKIKQ